MKQQNRSQTARLPCLFLALLFLFWNGTPALADSLPPSLSLPKVQTGTVSGRFVVQGGGAMAGGKVMFYNADSGPPPQIEQYKRVPTRIVGIDGEGTFQAIMPVGSYYLVAVKRNSGRQFGKPQQGDFSFRYSKPDSRELATFSLQGGDRLDLGTLAAHPWQEQSAVAVPGKTAIEGILTDVEGKPVANVLVFAFSTPRMQGRRPKFISEKTGQDGKYTLPIAGDATYYLLARDSIGGGQLREGEIFGVYGDRQPVGVSVKSGETVKGIDLRLSRMERRGPVETADGGQKTDTPAQVSGSPSRPPAALPGFRPEENGREKADIN